MEWGGWWWDGWEASEGVSGWFWGGWVCVVWDGGGVVVMGSG